MISRRPGSWSFGTGLILMIVGVIGAILSVIWMFVSSRRATTVQPVARDRRDVYY